MQFNIEVPLELPDVRLLRYERGEGGCFILFVESTRTTARCRKCKREISDCHGSDEPIRLRHLDLLGHPTFIEIKPKRFVCRFCDGKPTTTQGCSWYRRRSPFTRAFERYLLIALIGTTVAGVARKHGVGYHALLGVLDRWVKEPVHMRCLAPFDILGIDEISRRKGHKDFLAIITAYNSETRELIPLGLLPDRKKSTVKKFLKKLPEAIRLKVETVCIDLNLGFRNAVKETLPHVKTTADRFHVAKLYRNGVDNFRKKIQRQLKKTLPPEEYKKLKGALQPFRKDDTNLEKCEPLKELFRHSPELKTAYDFRKEMTSIFNNAPTKEEGTNQLAALFKKISETGVKCFDKFSATFEEWKEEITNYFTDRRNSGFVEGFNNSLKALKRRCYGFLNHKRFLKRLLLDTTGFVLLRIP